MAAGGQRMKERPIIFTGPMVRALLEGSKMQTRRAVKHAEFQPSETEGYDWQFRDKHMRWQDQTAAQMMARCPYGVLGDCLWARETWSHDAQSLEQCRAAHEDMMSGGSYGPYYRATESAPDTLSWRSPIHMPRWASRITLEVTAVHVERLQDISEADARNEGAEPNDGYAGPEKDRAKGWIKGYRILWEQINGPGSWGLNPWVWVIEFKRITP
jgi:hypothetical protein